MVIVNFVYHVEFLLVKKKKILYLSWKEKGLASNWIWPRDAKRVSRIVLSIYSSIHTPLPYITWNCLFLHYYPPSLHTQTCPATAGKLPRSCRQRFSLAMKTSQSPVTWLNKLLIMLEPPKVPLFPPQTNHTKRDKPLLRWPPLRSRHHRGNLPE